MKIFKFFGFLVCIFICVFILMLQIVTHLILGLGVFVEDDVLIKAANEYNVVYLLEDEIAEKTDLYYELVDIFNDRTNDKELINEILYSDSFKSIMKEIYVDETLYAVSGEERQDIDLIVGQNFDNLLKGLNNEYDFVEKTIIRSSVLDASNHVQQHIAIEKTDNIRIIKQLYSVLDFRILWIIVGVALIVTSILNWDIFMGLSFTGVTTALASCCALFVAKELQNAKPGFWGTTDEKLFSDIQPAFVKMGQILNANAKTFLILGIFLVVFSYTVSRLRKNIINSKE